jgi:hypothetical protein
MPILHSVFFYFKDDCEPDVIHSQKEAIIADLGRIEEVWDVRAGAPAGVQRDVVDNDYGMSLHLITENLQTLSMYQQHPLHVAFINNFKMYWKQVKVFDTKVDV